MSTALPTGTLTLAEFLALPEDGEVERELIRGEVRERPMTKRSRLHAKTQARLSKILGVWLDSLPVPKGELYAGEVGCILRRDPASNVGIDVAYFSAETVAAQTDSTSMVEGVPVLAVEILSPSDKQEDIAEKVDLYLETGVALVWILDPHFKTVVVHRGDVEPQLFNIKQSVRDVPQLPGLSLDVKDLFD